MHESYRHEEREAEPKEPQGGVVDKGFASTAGGAGRYGRMEGGARRFVHEGKHNTAGEDPEASCMSTALHYAQDPVNEVGESRRGDAICCPDVVLHAFEEGEQEAGGGSGETGATAFDHGDGWYHAVITGRCVVVEDAGIHTCLADNVIGEALEKDSTDCHFSAAGTKLRRVNESVFFSVVHESMAEDFTQANVEVGFD